MTSSRGYLDGYNIEQLDVMLNRNLETRLRILNYLDEIKEDITKTKALIDVTVELREENYYIRRVKKSLEIEGVA